MVGHYSKNILVYHFNGLWPHLIDLHKRISVFRISKLKYEAFIFPCDKGFFILVFQLEEDRDPIPKSRPYFCWITERGGGG
jgi:hypothetical protein